MYIVLYSAFWYYISGGGHMGKEYTEAQKRASLNYQKNKAQIKITVTPEQRKHYKALAESKGLSLTQLIIKLLEDAN